MRVLTAKSLPEVCSDTKIEPKLRPLSSEPFNKRTTSRSNEAKLDIRAGREGFVTLGIKHVMILLSFIVLKNDQIYFKILAVFTRTLSKSVVASWTRSKVCFVLLKSRFPRLRGSWTVCWKASGLNTTLIFPITLQKSKFSINNFLHF